MCRTVIETCPGCGGDGGYDPVSRWESGASWVRCIECNGAGQIEVPVVPAGIERLDEIDEQ